jgi:hypothetical protein
MTVVVLIQKCFSKRGGWPEPSKFAYFYENLLANCPYKTFFDVASLCDPANAALVETMSRMEEKDATTFFEITFRGPRGGGPPSIQRSTKDVYKTFCKLKNLKLTHLLMLVLS